MADHHGTTCEVFNCVFQCAQRFDVQIVGRFIEQQHVAPALQHLGHVNAVAFPA